MSWEQIAGGAVVATTGLALAVRDYRKSRKVDAVSADSGIALLIDNLQEDNRDVRARLVVCEKDCADLREIVAQLRRPHNEGETK